MKYVDGSVFYGYIREKWYFWMDKSKRDIYFHNLMRIKWRVIADGRKCSSEWSTKTTKQAFQLDVL